MITNKYNIGDRVKVKDKLDTNQDFSEYEGTVAWIQKKEFSQGLRYKLVNCCEKNNFSFFIRYNINESDIISKIEEPKE